MLSPGPDFGSAQFWVLSCEELSTWSISVYNPWLCSAQPPPANLGSRHTLDDRFKRLDYQWWKCISYPVSSFQFQLYMYLLVILDFSDCRLLLFDVYSETFIGHCEGPCFPFATSPAWVMRVGVFFPELIDNRYSYFNNRCLNACVNTIAVFF